MTPAASGRLRPHDAFTLVEVVVSVLLAIVVVGTAVGMLVHAMRSVSRSEERLEPREAAHLALTAIRLELTDAWDFSVSADSGAVSFTTPRGTGKVAWDASRATLVLTPPDSSSPRVLIGSRVVRFAAREVTPGNLRLSLELDRPRTSTMQALEPLKIIDTILVPCVGLRQAGIPWSYPLEYPEARGR